MTVPTVTESVSEVPELSDDYYTTELILDQSKILLKMFYPYNLHLTMLFVFYDFFLAYSNSNPSVAKYPFQSGNYTMEGAISEHRLLLPFSQMV